MNQGLASLRLTSTLSLFAFVVCLASAGETCAQCRATYKFAGEAPNDQFGISVDGAGDVDGDGYADVIVGAWLNDAGGGNAGRAYVYSGFNGTVIYTFTGENLVYWATWFGQSVAGAGDVNGDGYADVIVGDNPPDNADDPLPRPGRAYVYSGLGGNLIHTFTGEAPLDAFGGQVLGAGDVDADGFDDLVVGAWLNDAGGTDAGRVYVYSGLTGALLYTLTGEAAFDHFGGAVSDAGDVNNDGFDDLIVGAHRNNAGGDKAGRAYVYSGVTGALIHAFTGEAADDEFGLAVSGAGDVDGDGYSDLIVGAWQNDAGGVNAGRAYVYSGFNGNLIHVLTGESSGIRFGISVSSAGDIDGDGYTDLIVGAAFSGAGRAYVYSGLSGNLIHVLTGEASSDKFGRCVSTAGDVNNDGIADIVVGATDAAGTGRAYVFTCSSIAPIPVASSIGAIALVVGLMGVGVILLRRKMRIGFPARCAARVIPTPVDNS